MRALLVPVSVGELLDKITILKIKKRRITDPSKLVHINAELEALIKVCEAEQLELQTPLFKQLEAVNEKLWDIEDAIRDKERIKQFDGEFIELARSVYVTNDQRFTLKSALNKAFGSILQEEKSYKDYSLSK